MRKIDVNLGRIKAQPSSMRETVAANPTRLAALADLPFQGSFQGRYSEYVL